MVPKAIDESIPVACQVGAIPQDERARWLEVGREFYSAVEEVLELPDGFAMRLNPQRLGLLGEYVMRDRLCCTFVQWEVVVEQANGPAWLKVRGPRGTKEFMAAAIESTDMLPLEVARKAGFSVDKRAKTTLDNVASMADKLRNT